jgi:hypothetical protein
VLAHAILVEGVRNVTAGASAIDLKRNDERMGALVAEAVEKVGSEGVITVEEAKASCRSSGPGGAWPGMRRDTGGARPCLPS